MFDFVFVSKQISDLLEKSDRLVVESQAANKLANDTLVNATLIKDVLDNFDQVVEEGRQKLARNKYMFDSIDVNCKESTHLSETCENKLESVKQKINVNTAQLNAVQLDLKQSQVTYSNNNKRIQQKQHI